MKTIKSIMNLSLGYLLTWGAYYGYFHLGYAGFENVMVIFGWFASVIGTMMLFMKDGSMESIKPSPIWLTIIDRLIDLSFSVVLAYHGYMWLSVFYTIHIIGTAKHKDYARKNQ